MPFKILGMNEIPGAKEKLLKLQEEMKLPFEPQIRRSGKLPNIIKVNTAPDDDDIARVAISNALPTVSIQGLGLLAP